MADYGDKYRGNTHNGVDVRTGDYRKPSYDNDTEERKYPSGLVSRGHKIEYLVTKIERTVHSAVDKQRHISPADVEKRKVDLENENMWRKPAGQVRDRPKFMPLSTSQWRHKTQNHNDGGDKLEHRKHELAKEEPPSLIEAGGWVRPNRAMWASPPDGVAAKPAGSLSNPTNDIDQALEYLKEAAFATGKPESRLKVAVPVGVKRDGYGKSNGSREAQRRYGNGKAPAWQRESNGGTIDSREAAKKYGGTGV